MTDQSTTKPRPPRRRRKTAALVVGFFGVASLAMAAATQLNLFWAGNFQAGAVTVNADCQTSQITVGYDAPTFTAAQNPHPWSITNVNFTNIDAACATLDYEVAYKTTGNWVSLGTGTVGGTSVAVPVAAIGAANLQDVTEYALTIHG